MHLAAAHRAVIHVNFVVCIMNNQSSISISIHSASNNNKSNNGKHGKEPVVAAWAGYFGWGSAQAAHNSDAARWRVEANNRDHL